MERQCYDDTQINKMVRAMLTSESAGGGSKSLKTERTKFLRFFSILPNPTSMGMTHLSDRVFQQKFEGDLGVFYQHISEKHRG